ncbi:acyclic terpene utilization AtuA family protein [Allosalinactinospora lopnorensis]|uniref:acyclic terpene utilization AtuA family protein n=1 Tax=Allosalinactinospora lopnorensis TaxID=1352348 RepID=UPI000623F03F|nr:acyclic terpene utilization AtuA family protein [Allosalinactinospora lopnorensis]
MNATPAASLRVGNASGFYGDRFAAVREMLADGPLDVLTGDYLAELTMLILGRDRLRDPGLGYARTFLRQMEQCLGPALERGVAVVVNAGGLNPAGLADRLRELAERLGLRARIGHVEGDDLMGRTAELALGQPLTANAYLGAWGIAECLRGGADVVVTGRVTDASLAVGPAAAHFGWERDDYDALAGATVAGHVIECGAQATGGNYPFFAELEAAGYDLTRPGFPVAEIHADGSSVITKHEGTGGAVTTGTVTAQLVYEIAGACYPGPDVTARLDTAELAQEAPDRVRISGVLGQAPSPELKVGLTRMSGFANEMTLVLTGLDADAKAELAERQMRAALAGNEPADLDFRLTRRGEPDAGTQDGASAHLRITARDPDPGRVGRSFSSAAVELALAGFPGFHATSPPSEARPDGLAFASGSLPAGEAAHTAVLPDGTRVDIAPAAAGVPPSEPPEPPLPAPLPHGRTREVPLGAVFGARSGDKGSSANIGVWAPGDDAWRWLAHRLTADRLRELLPETAPLPVTRYLLPNLRAVNFVVDGLLDGGAAANGRSDPQAKGLAEWLRGRRVLLPEELLG